MKTTVNIPDNILSDLLYYSNKKSKKEAIVMAMQEYINKKKMEAFASKLGTLDGLISSQELQKLRRKR